MQHPVFETRLRSIIDAILRLNPLFLTTTWKKDLEAPGRDLDYWVTSISRSTLDDVKQLLSRDNPPSPKDFRSLTVVRDVQCDPGAYLGVAELEDEECYVYQGSATAVGLGLAHRTKHHANPGYRKNQLA
jgi:hypothetical protein